MTNAFLSNNPRLHNVISMIQGHNVFLNANTGETNNRLVDHFSINPQGILANNKHFIADNRQEAQPDGDATTEGQTLLIIGYAMAYMGTKNPEYLQKAEYYWQAYVDYFYAGQPIPDSPQRWICNWIVNGKEPVLAHWPIDPVYPTHGGVKDKKFQFVNGETQIPHGAPYWGEYLDNAYQAYEGNLGWGAVNATVYAKKANGETDWDHPIPEFAVDWAIVRARDKDTGAVVARKVWDQGEHDPVNSSDLSLIGKVKVKQRDAFDPNTYKPTGQKETANGEFTLSYAPRLPVAEGGRLIQRNEVQHNRPVHVPLVGSVNQMGNAADAEVWFGECCYLLWKITNNDKYKKALDCTLFTSNEYTDLDRLDRFFRQSKEAETPWTDGISYDYSYSSDDQHPVEIEYSRRADGLIQADITNAGALSMEQQSINYKVEKTNILEVNAAGYTANGQGNVSVVVELGLSPIKADEKTEIRYRYALDPTQSNDPRNYLIELDKMYTNGPHTQLADDRVFTTWGNAEYDMSFAQDVIGYDGAICTATYTATTQEPYGGLIVGFWLMEHKKSVVNGITYECDTDFQLKITDNNKWVWHWALPRGKWQHLALDTSTLILNSYQPDHPDTDPKPSAPSNLEFDQINIVPEDDSIPIQTFKLFNMNELPTKYNSNTPQFVGHFTITGSSSQSFSMVVGDCYMKTYAMGSLMFTPGVVPFSNIYDEYTPIISAWHGLPYPGYQSPLTFILHPDLLKLNNQIDFLLASQEAYTQTFPGEVGPGMSAFVWNRWDAVKYAPKDSNGKPILDTWIMTHWGDHAWDGYQARAYYWACRAWYELVKRGQPVPAKLVTYCSNWATWLMAYQKRHGITPTWFPKDKPAEPNGTISPTNPYPDYTGHMNANWLGGSCLIRMAGHEIDGLDNYIEQCVDELYNNYNVVDAGNIMNGSWTGYLDKQNPNDSQFVGFWAGEILKSLGLYLMYKQGVDFEWF